MSEIEDINRNHEFFYQECSKAFEEMMSHLFDPSAEGSKKFKEAQDRFKTAKLRCNQEYKKLQ